MKRRRCIQGPDHEAGGDVAMTRREAKSRAVISSANCPITWRSRPKRCEASRIVKVTFGAAAALSVAPLTYSLRRDDGDLVVFCFAEPEGAEAFAKRFGWEQLATCSRRLPWKHAGHRTRCSGRTQRAARQVI
jgi:hypothetical protein